MASVSTNSPHFSTEKPQLISKEVAEMVQKGAVEQIHPSEGYNSNLFLVPKKDGG